MLLAAELWAVARQEGRPAADEKALDGDVILAAQTRLLAVPRNETIVATVNVGHIARVVHADLWQRIQSV
ncbi:MAG: hypothetical protein QOG89_3175 [Thermomicrobiales bacterium]|jgi:hypothetical protein|nr:hypothetical protein [Thermomicrobiales bacterium]